MAATEIYTLSLHDALPIWFAIANQAKARMDQFGAEEPAAHLEHAQACSGLQQFLLARIEVEKAQHQFAAVVARMRSEEHTSELQSHSDLVCRLLLEKKKRR